MSAKKLEFRIGLTAPALSIQINENISGQPLSIEELEEFDFHIAAINRLELHGLLGGEDCIKARQRVLVKLAALLNSAKRQKSQTDKAH
jgi:hypothetical protein